nr:YdcF family protein [Roseibium hamelinense]
MIVLGVVGAILLFTRFGGVGRAAVVLSLAGMLLLGLSPAANWLIQPLEDRFSRPSELQDISGVIVLGGSVDTVVTGARKDTALTSSGERLTIAARLARALPGAKIIHTGGHGVIIPSQATEAEGAARLFADFGIDPERVVLEDKSRNTWENAVLTKGVLQPQPGQKWLLVTSAYHMPRAVGVFEAAGWSGVVPYPVDYRTRGPEDVWRGFAGASTGMRRFDIAFKEWIGLAVYRLTGRSSAFFPGPAQTE